MRADWVDGLTRYIAERWQITDEKDLRIRILSLPPSASDELAQAKAEIERLCAVREALSAELEKQIERGESLEAELKP